MTKLNRNVIAFQRGMFLLDGDENHRDLACTIQAELMHFGYMLTEKAFERLSHATRKAAIEFHDQVLSWVKTVMGDGNYHPLYAGFPTQVMNMTDQELFFNAFLHYISGGTFIPAGCSAPVREAFEQTKYRMVDVADETRFRQIFTDLLSVNQSITPNDQEVLDWFMKNYSHEELQGMMPEKIPFRETLCRLAIELDLYPRKMTATDALRIIVGKSGGNIVLPVLADPIRKFSRQERRTLLGMLERIPLRADEMKRYEKRWIRVGEQLHPGDYARQFPKTWKAFQALRNTKVHTWYGAVENAETLEKKLDLLAQRPGEFARQLDALLRVGTEGQREYARHLHQKPVRKHHHIRLMRLEILQRAEEEARIRRERAEAIARAREYRLTHPILPNRVQMNATPAMIAQAVEQAQLEDEQIRMERANHRISRSIRGKLTKARRSQNGKKHN